MTANCKPTPSRPFDKLRASSDAHGGACPGNWTVTLGANAPHWSLAPGGRVACADGRGVAARQPGRLQSWQTCHASQSYLVTRPEIPGRSTRLSQLPHAVARESSARFIAPSGRLGSPRRPRPGLRRPAAQALWPRYLCRWPDTTWQGPQAPWRRADASAPASSP